jgi:hypothetical protein
MLKTMAATSLALAVIPGAVAPGTTETTPVPSHPVPTACAEAAWPHYGADCVHTRLLPADRPREVRTIAIDRPSRPQQ